jgi:hypothetical protein
LSAFCISVGSFKATAFSTPTPSACATHTPIDHYNLPPPTTTFPLSTHAQPNPTQQHTIDIFKLFLNVGEHEHELCFGFFVLFAALSQRLRYGQVQRCAGPCARRGRCGGGRRRLGGADGGGCCCGGGGSGGCFLGLSIHASGK